MGLIGKQGVSSPVVLRDKVVGFTDPWFHRRKFLLDMAGFAFNVDLLSESGGARMPFVAGMEEDGFLRALGVEYSDLEAVAEGCTEVLVWHTQTEKSRGASYRRLRDSHLSGSNLPALLRRLSAAGVLEVDDEARNALPVCMQERCH